MAGAPRRTRRRVLAGLYAVAWAAYLVVSWEPMPPSAWGALAGAVILTLLIIVLFRIAGWAVRKL